MNIVDIITKIHINKNYTKLKKNVELFESQNKYGNVCYCENFTPFIKNGPCRFCFKYNKKSDYEILKQAIKQFEI